MRKQNINETRNYRAMMRDNFWMLMGLIYSSNPKGNEPARREAAEASGGELEYLFDNPTGTNLDIDASKELYFTSDEFSDALSDADLHICNDTDHEHDSFDDTDFDSDIW